MFCSASFDGLICTVRRQMDWVIHDKCVRHAIVLIIWLVNHKSYLGAMSLPLSTRPRDVCVLGTPNGAYKLAVTAFRK